MMQKIQKFGGAMFTPVLLFAFAGMCVGIGTLCTSEVILGSLAASDGMWYKIWNIVLQGGWTVFNQLPILFAVSLPIGLAKHQNARCCMEALVVYLTFNYFLSTILEQWGPSFGVDFAADVGATSGLTMIAGIKTLDMGMMGALLISGLTIFIHNRYFNTELPEWLGIFNGSTFVVIISFFVMIPVAFIAAILWPQVQHGISLFQVFLANSGAAGVGVFVFLERILIPTGLHHFVYSPFYYDSVVVDGGLYAYWANQLPELAASSEPLKTLIPQAGFSTTGLSKIFGCPGIALAIYSTAKPGKKKKIAGLLIPITLTAILCGVTEPLEFTFLFIAPMLFLVHAVLAALLATVSYIFGVVGIFGGGIIEMASFNWIPLMKSHSGTYLVQFIIGFIFMAIYFVVFRTLILKFNIKTPGREDDDQESKFISKKEYREAKGKDKTSKSSAGDIANERRAYAASILEGLGGKDNIADVTNCATRLRVNVKDETLVEDQGYFQSLGAHGLSKSGKAVQVIVGLSVAKVRAEFETLL